MRIEREQARAIFRLTWPQVHLDLKELTVTISRYRPYDDFKFDTIVAPLYGGLIPATLIAKELKIRTIIPVKFPEWLQVPLIGTYGNLLFVDDILDTGRTLTTVLSQKIWEVYSGSKSRVCAAVIATKPEGREVAEKMGIPVVSVRQYEQDCWVDFAWEKSDG